MKDFLKAVLIAVCGIVIFLLGFQHGFELGRKYADGTQALDRASRRNLE